MLQFSTEAVVMTVGLATLAALWIALLWGVNRTTGMS